MFIIEKKRKFAHNGYYLREKGIHLIQNNFLKNNKLNIILTLRVTRLFKSFIKERERKSVIIYIYFPKLH